MTYGDGRTEAQERADDSRMIREGMQAAFPGTATAEQIAQAFHETYERLAPDFGYKTREASAKPWAEVPEQNKMLMIAVVQALLAGDVITTRLPGGTTTGAAASDVNAQQLAAVLEQIYTYSSDDDIRDHVRQVVKALRGNGLIFLSGPPQSDEDRIRGAMAEAQDHPGRTITR
jgi:hypothetical protein